MNSAIPPRRRRGLRRHLGVIAIGDPNQLAPRISMASSPKPSAPALTVSHPGAPHCNMSEASVNTMRKLLAHLATLPVGTTVAAAMDFGPIVKGQWGIVTGRHAVSALPWRRAVYLCTFLGGLRVTASRAQIVAVRHGRSLQSLDDPFWFLHGRRLADRPLQHEVEVRRYISRT
jgi:hypothetical protein